MHMRQHENSPAPNAPAVGDAPAGGNAVLWRMWLVFGLTAAVMLAELVGAAWSGSLTLLADAGHMFVDGAGLAIALAAVHIMRRPRSDRFTWGFARTEVISAAVQASMLLIVCVSVAIEAVHRFWTPTAVQAGAMAIFAVIGLLANVVGMLVLHSHAQTSLNTRAAFLEVANDALGSVAVLAAAGVTALTQWERTDAVASLLVAGLMAPRALRMLARCVRILLEGTPVGIDVAKVRQHLLSQPRVLDVHDLHVYSIASDQVALTAHVSVEPAVFRDGGAVPLLHALQDCVNENFSVPISHCTIQMDVPAHRDHEQLRH